MEACEANMRAMGAFAWCKLFTAHSDALGCDISSITQGRQCIDWRFSDSNMMHTTAIGVDGSCLHFL